MHSGNCNCCGACIPPRSATTSNIWHVCDDSLMCTPRHQTATRSLASYMPSFFVGCGHVTSYVTFVDHSESGVDLPDRKLLRMHAALTGVLHQSRADDVFGYLRLYVPWLYSGCDAGRSIYPASTGSALGKSVVAYEGPEVCLEVELWEAAEALGDATGASPHATPQ